METPSAFSVVHPRLYRSATFSSAHLPFVRSLKLKTILSVGEDLPSRVMQKFVTDNEANGLRFFNVSTRSAPPTGPLGRSWRPVSEDLVKDALEFILEAENQPCLVMDLSGIYETGIVFGCLRKLERWTLSSLLAEYARHAGSKSRGINEQFIELFDTDLVNIPPKERRVAWFKVPQDVDIE